MNHRLHLLDSFPARGSDGAIYKVRAFEHLVHCDALPADGREHWEPTGRLEYRLDDGRRVEVRRDGSLQVVGGEMALQPPH